MHLWKFKNNFVLQVEDGNLTTIDGMGNRFTMTAEFGDFGELLHAFTSLKSQKRCLFVMQGRPIVRWRSRRGLTTTTWGSGSSGPRRWGRGSGRWWAATTLSILIIKYLINTTLSISLISIVICNFQADTFIEHGVLSQDGMKCVIKGTMFVR